MPLPSILWSILYTSHDFQNSVKKIVSEPALSNPFATRHMANVFVSKYLKTESVDSDGPGC